MTLDWFGHYRGDEAELQRRLKEFEGHLPRPVIWLLGKAQSGKTSIVQALTGDPRAKIGTGFEPCTRDSWRYAFPNKELPLVEFLDTRGLNDTAYDPREDIAWHEKQSHLVMAVMRVMDPAQESIHAIVKEIKRRHPEWPVILVQTCLHEGYPWREPRHIEPYPFDCDPLPKEVPSDLARAIQWQRDMFRGLHIHPVVIDFTLPEDGFEPQFYGLEQLWDAIEKVLPLAIWGIIKNSKELREKLAGSYTQAAEAIITTHATVAAAGASVPIPAIDLPVILAVQFSMAQQLAQLYGQKLTADRFWDLLGTLGWGFMTRWGLRYLSRQILKFIPWLGIAVGAAFTWASTYALGRALEWYFREIKLGHLPEPETLRKMYSEAFRTAKASLEERQR